MTHESSRTFPFDIGSDRPMAARAYGWVLGGKDNFYADRVFVAQALLADNANTTVITADMTQPEQILNHPEAQRLIDFETPVAVLMFSIGHCIPEDAAAHRALHGPMEAAAPGSYLALSHIVADTQTHADALTSTITDLGMPWKTRTPEVIDTWLADLEPVEPGLCDITWRVDSPQPPLGPIPPEISHHINASHTHHGIYEYGGVLKL